MSELNLYEQAKALVIKEKNASPSFLQRRLWINYMMACRFLEELEREGVVGPSRLSQPREVLL